MPTPAEIATALADFAFAERAYLQKLKNLRAVANALLDKPPKDGDVQDGDGEILNPPLT